MEKRVKSWAKPSVFRHFRAVCVWVLFVCVALPVSWICKSRTISHTRPGVRRSNLFSCFYWLDLQTYSVCVDVSQQPLGDSRVLDRSRLSRVRHFRDRRVPAGTLGGGGDSVTETVSKGVSMLQTGIKSFLLLEASQSKERWRKSLFLGSQEMSRCFVLL